MCHERWEKARDDGVESSYLRDLRQRDHEDAPTTESAEPITAEALLDAEPVIAAAGDR